MKVKKQLAVRSDGKGLIRFAIQDIPLESTLRMSVYFEDGGVVPSSLYPTAVDSEYVVVLPLLKAKNYQVAFRAIDAEGKVVGTESVKVSLEKLKWESRVNYRTKGEASRKLKDTEKNYLTGIIRPEVFQVIDDEDHIIVHARVISDLPYENGLVAYGGDGNKLPVCMIPMSDGFYDCGSHLKFSLHEKTFSCRIEKAALPVMLGLDAPSDCFVNGFSCIPDLAYRKLHPEYMDLTCNVGKFARYPLWFSVTKANNADIVHQKANQPENGSCAFVLHGHATAEAMSSMLSSLLGQTYFDWRVSVEKLEDSEARLVSAVLGSEKIVESAFSCDYVMPLELGYVLEPDYLYETTLALANSKDMAVFADHDYIDKGVNLCPWVKPAFSQDLLYSLNYVGPTLLMRSALYGLCQVEGSQRAANSAFNALLCCIENGYSIGKICRILVHFNDLEYDKTNEWKQQGELLAQHFSRMGLEGTILDCGEGRRKIEWNLPSQPKISIIIPNKDKIDYLDPCIRSILDQSTYSNYEIVVVENNSTEQSTFDYYDELVFHESRVKVVRFDGTFNFSKIVNFGVRESDGEYVLLLNNDTQLITPEFLEEMMGYAIRDNVGVVGAKLLYRDHTVQHAGVVVGPNGMADHLNHGVPDAYGGYLGLANTVQNLSGVTGACQLIPRSVYDQVGGYDEDFQVAYNDVDFCLKVKNAGYLIVYTPYAKLYHYEFTSRGKDSPLEKRLRSEKEASMLHVRWPEYYVVGDEFYNSLFDKDGVHYVLDGTQDLLDAEKE